MLLVIFILGLLLGIVLTALAAVWLLGEVARRLDDRQLLALFRAPEAFLEVARRDDPGWLYPATAARTWLLGPAARRRQPS
jgi:hypothetical protein